MTRTKTNLKFKRIYSQSVNKTAGIRFDQIIILSGHYPNQDYPEKLRRIGYVDLVTNKRLIFLTNNMVLSAEIIAGLYKARWQVELFFKWIKQHLRIKVFYGTSENAVKTQIWIAISVYVLIAIIRKELKIKHSLYTILQILSAALFEKTPILQAFAENPYADEKDQSWEQLELQGRSLGQ